MAMPAAIEPDGTADEDAEGEGEEEEEEEVLISIGTAIGCAKAGVWHGWPAFACSMRQA